MVSSKKDQLRFNVTFRGNDKEIELYNWIKDKGQIGGVSNYIKTILNREMLQEQREGK